MSYNTRVSVIVIEECPARSQAVAPGTPLAGGVFIGPPPAVEVDVVRVGVAVDKASLAEQMQPVGIVRTRGISAAAPLVFRGVAPAGEKQC